MFGILKKQLTIYVVFISNPMLVLQIKKTPDSVNLYLKVPIPNKCFTFVTYPNKNELHL